MKSLFLPLNICSSRFHALLSRLLMLSPRRKPGSSLNIKPMDPGFRRDDNISNQDDNITNRNDNLGNFHSDGKVKSLSSLSLSLLLFSSLSLATPSDDLKKELNSLSSMEAQFTQITTTEKSKETQLATGNMALQRPGKFRWETQKPNEQLILADGTWIWIYDKDLEQATKQSQATTNSNNPALFLSGDVSTVDKRFKVSFVNDHFILKAKADDDMFQSMSLYFSNGSIEKMIVKTRLDQSSEFSFTGVKKNIKLSTKLFTFTPPKGTDIIQN